MLSVKKLSFSYRKNEKAIDKISFTLNEGQILGIAGESGSGKSTLIGLIYGLLAPESGEILMHGKRVKNVNEQLIAGHHEMQLAGQTHQLQNSVTILEQIKYKLLRYEKKYREIKALELLSLVGLENKKDAFPNQISGGQQQLVNLCCALAEEPQLLLLDEPFNNLDQSSKENLKDYLIQLKNDLNLSIIIISHDPVDLLSISDEIMVLKTGKVIQKGNSEKIYFEPKNKYVARLFGEFNWLEKNKKKKIIRPSQIVVSPEKMKGFKNGKVIDFKFMGSYYLVKVNLSKKIILVNLPFLLNQEEIWLKW